VKPGLVLKKMQIVPTPHCNVGAECTSVEITYGNVAGRLVSEGRPTGFAVLDEDGLDVRGIYKTTLEGSRALLHTNMPRHQLEMLSVSYGHGRQPYCNITDAEGLSLPAMQAIAVAPDHALELRKWKTARLPGVKSIARVSFARAGAARGWRAAPPRAGFGVLPKPAEADRVGVYALRTSWHASEPLEAVLLFGANAPFKIWLNGKRVFADAGATVPLNPGQYTVPLNVRRGRNTLLVAFAPPGPGAHLGISARVGTPELRVGPRITL
jgi:hypothetical protein